MRTKKGIGFARVGDLLQKGHVGALAEHALLVEQREREHAALGRDHGDARAVVGEFDGTTCPRPPLCTLLHVAA